MMSRFIDVPMSDNSGQQIKLYKKKIKRYGKEATKPNRKLTNEQLVAKHCSMYDKIETKVDRLYQHVPRTVL